MIISSLSRTMNAVRFVQENANALWLVLGNPNAWTAPNSDSSPPVEDPTAISLIDPICAIVATPVLVYETEGSGTYHFKDANNNDRYFTAQTNLSTAIEDNLTLVLLTAETSGSNIVGLSVTNFRQFAFFTNLVPASGFTGQEFLAAANISEYGQLETLENSVPQSVQSADTYSMTFLYQF